MRSLTSKDRLITHHNPKSPISEAYRSLRTNIRFSAVDEEMKVIMAASAKPGEGKTLTISNLAVTYAQEGKKVVVVDADLRKPTVHQIFRLSNRSGLTNILADQHTLDEQIRTTFIEHLEVLPSGPVPPNPSEMLASRRMSALIDELKDRYDVVLVDSPPILAVTDAQIIAAQSDGVILVVQEGKSKKELARKAKASLDHVKARILGVVLNHKRRKNAESYYYYYYYGNPKETRL